MMTVTVSPDFSKLRDFTTRLPQTFESQGRVIHNSRNVIRMINTGEGTFVVKHFKGMYFFNKLAYSFFRKSKAARSYLYSQILNERGILTPPHVAWIDCYQLGLLSRSYFVSVYFPYKTLEHVMQYYDIYEPAYKQSLLHYLAAFVFKLHQLKIYHEDLSLGNILVIRTPGGYDFALVDLNRIKFEQVEFRRGLKNFATLRLSKEDMNMLLTEYTRMAGVPRETSIKMFWRFENRKSFIRRLRRKIRRYTITPLEKLLYPAHS